MGGGLGMPGCAAVWEPGIGKTRTAAEVAQVAFAEGAIVLYGRCDEEVGAPYQPFAEALDWSTKHVDEPVLGRHPGELIRLQLLLGSRLIGLAAPPVEWGTAACHHQPITPRRWRHNPGVPLPGEVQSPPASGIVAPHA